MPSWNGTPTPTSTPAAGAVADPGLNGRSAGVHHAAADGTKDRHVLLYRALLLCGLLVGAIMLLAFPLAKPIWTDEYINSVWGESSLQDILSGRALAPDALPLHPLLLHGAYVLFGDNLLAFRVISAVPSAIGLWFVYQIGRRFSERTGLLALWLCALSPGLVLYDRMARYHGLTALLCTLAVWSALRALDSARPRDAVLHCVVTWLMLTSYPLSMFVVAGEACCLLLLWRSERLARGRWLVLSALAVAAMAFAPLIVHSMMRVTHEGMTQVTVEDPAVGQGPRGFLLRFVLPVYVYCVGETVYPWSFAVSVPGIVAALGAYLIGARTLWRSRRAELLLPVICFTVILLSALATSGKFGASQTVGSMAKRVSFAMPLFYLTQSVGIGVLLDGATAARRRIGIVLITVLMMVSIVSLSNYWRGREFLNPNYTASWGEALDTMRSAQPLDSDTYVFSRGELALDYALRGGVSEPMPAGLHADNQVITPDDIARDLAANPARYIWLVGRDRGDRTAVDAFLRMNAYLKTRYRHVGSFGVMPRSASERRWFRRVMKRDATPNYIWMELYEVAPAAPVGTRPSAAAMPAEVH